MGRFECGMAVPARPVDCVEQRADSSFLDLDPDTTYRIRVVNTGYVLLKPQYQSSFANFQTDLWRV